MMVVARGARHDDEGQLERRTLEAIVAGRWSDPPPLSQNATPCGSAQKIAEVLFIQGVPTVQ